MNKKTIEAVKAGVKRYRGLAKAPKKELEDAKFGVRDCALCLLFWRRDDPKTCARCPVFARTGLRLCEGTPWHSVGESGLAADNLPVVQMYAGSDYSVRHLRRRCTAEADFLESLLPADETAPPEEQ